jgi:AraC-like DNA-binding protein
LRKQIKISFILRDVISIIVFFLFSNFYGVYAEESLPDLKEIIENNTSSADIIASYNSVIIKGAELNQRTLIDSSQILRWTAIEYAQNNNAEQASIFIEKYINATLRVGFINNDVFDIISDSEDFIALKDKYKVNFSLINLFYLFTSLVGLFIFIVLNLKKKSKNSSNFLISLFVLMHSIFILDLFFFLTNLRYSYPHSLFMSITFSFLYGPVIYFYYKKIALNYTLKWRDVLHLIPTVIIFIVILPYYFFPIEEKLKMMLELSAISTKELYDYIFILKLSSLIIYSFLIVRIFYKFSRFNKKLSTANLKWQRGLARLVSIYVVFYLVYGLIIVSEVIPRIEFIFHLQIVTMAIMVLYIGYKVYLIPTLFSSEFFENENNKYKKSGLTTSFSNDLKEKLIFLFENEKIYRQNDSSLEILSNKLDTTRHNTSQVINEHFNLNFFELINKYRIAEALDILQSDTHNNLNIIDVAYEVGFNNKVTFNKSFKKIISLTPSQYIASLSS